MSRMSGIDAPVPSPCEPPLGFVMVADPLDTLWFAIGEGAREPAAPRTGLRLRAHTFAIALVLATVAVAGVVMVAAGGGTASACGTAGCASSGFSLSTIASDLQPGGVASETTPGEPSPFFSPPPVADPSAPARVVLSGPDAPDPFVLVDGSHEYMYTSNGTLTHVNVPEYTLLADHRWGDLRDALPKLPAWAFGGYTWAPDVRRVLGGWALYFTAAVRGASPPMQCIGEAFGPSPLGPFEPVQKLFICQVGHRGSIDPRTFVDAQGNLWLYWKSDDNANPRIPWTTGNGFTGIYAQRLSASGRVLLGSPSLMLQPSLPWEGTIVEAPDMLFEQGRYWMFYSGNWFNSPQYAIGVAQCEGPVGPCSPVTSQPLLSSNYQGAGPGEESVFEDSSGIWMLYAPWASNVPRPTPNRPVAEVRLGFGPAGPYIASSGP